MDFFGDTFGSDFYPNFVNPGPNGSNWRSNVLLFSDDQDLSDGLTINGATMDESGKMLVKYVMEVKMEVVMEIGLLFPQQPFVPMA